MCTVQQWLFANGDLSVTPNLDIKVDQIRDIRIF